LRQKAKGEKRLVRLTNEVIRRKGGGGAKPILLTRRACGKRERSVGKGLKKNPDGKLQRGPLGARARNQSRKHNRRLRTIIAPNKVREGTCFRAEVKKEREQLLLDRTKKRVWLIRGSRQ